jgi:hypothetical protein
MIISKSKVIVEEIFGVGNVDHARDVFGSKNCGNVMTTGVLFKIVILSSI